MADVELDKRGVPSSVAATVEKSEEKLVGLLAKGRIEQMIQKKFVLIRDKYELKMRFKADQMNDLKDKMKMLDSDDDDGKEELMQQWKALRKEKNQIYKAWCQFTEDEEARRNVVEIEWRNNAEQDALTELTTPTSAEDRKSPSAATREKRNLEKGTTVVSQSTAPYVQKKNDTSVSQSTAPFQPQNNATTDTVLKKNDTLAQKENGDELGSSSSSESESEDDEEVSVNSVDPNPDDPKKYEGYEIDHNAEKIKLTWTKCYDDGSTRLHQFEVRPCKVFKVMCKKKSQEGSKYQRAASKTTLHSVQELKAKTWNFKKYDYSINSNKWIEPTPTNNIPKILTTKPSHNKDKTTEKPEEDAPNIGKDDLGEAPRIILKKGDGANYSRLCMECGKHPTGHYCVTPKRGSNIFFSNNMSKEVCGIATCFSCKQKHCRDISGKFKNYCIMCTNRIINENNEEKKENNKKRKQNTQSTRPLRRSARGGK